MGVDGFNAAASIITGVALVTTVAFRPGQLTEQRRTAPLLFRIIHWGTLALVFATSVTHVAMLATGSPHFLTAAFPLFGTAFMLSWWPFIWRAFQTPRATPPTISRT